MEHLQVAVALVQKVAESGTCWLLHEQNGRLEFVVGQRLEKESFRDTVIREVSWRLNLDRRLDLLVANMSQLSIEFDEPTADGGERHVAVAFYNVHLKERVIGPIDDDNSSIWISASEICAGLSKCGKPIDPEIVGWINRYEIIRPWQT